MATQLIKHLKNCADNDSIYKPLEYQWGFDEQLIAKALQNVSMYFPHYSRHDESHSRQILVHIERLLGENLTKLTATDTWLLLEAAYLHDIGMVVTDEQLNKHFDEIKQHAESMKYSASDELLNVIHALSSSKENTSSAIFASVNIPAFQTLKLLREIIADYYRKKHPEQAGKIINNPFNEIGLDSPRNELLPARFFKLLSKICEYHGADFEKVMDLPQQQVGMGTENCHPRFVACLLRLGDLLDLDDNRFCPVMMKMAGDLPALSQAHHQKHLAIRHFRADPNRIEIDAECPDYESYIQTTNWFGWLRSEVQNQMSRWFEIVPSRKFGLLPSVGDLKAHLKEWQVFSENQRPHFELDRDRIFELLQGAGLYECKEQAMRELLQNAVDATLIRIWREYGEDCQPRPESFIARDSAPRDEKVRQILDKYSIDVTIEKEKEEGEFNYWRITIADQGTGISRDDLKFMLQMGSSKKNRQRRAIIEKMPVWMKPSGIFGIGLHSVFLLTDEVLIETRSIDTGETLVIRLTNPTDKKEHGNVYFQIITKPTKIELNNINAKEKTQEFKPWDFSDYGCKLNFVYKTDKTYSAEYIYGDIENETLKNNNTLTEPIEDMGILNLIETIPEFSQYSFIKVKWNSSNEYHKLKIKYLEIGLNELTFIENGSYCYNCEESLEILHIDIPIRNPHYSHSSPICFYYRGQAINYYHSFFFFIDIDVNLLDDEADKLLTINRKEFKDSNIAQELYNRVSRTIKFFFESKNEGKDFYKKLEEDCKELLAAEYELQNWDKPSYFSSDWRQLSITTGLGRKEKIENLKNYDTIYGVSDVKFDYFDFKIQLENLNEYSGEGTIEINNYISSENISAEYRLVNKFLKENGFKSNIVDFEIVKIRKNQEQSISENVLIKYCENKLIKCGFSNGSLKRKTIPSLSNYKLLELDNPNILPLSKNKSYHTIEPDFELDLISPRMLFPLARIGDKITVGDLNILAKRVYKNRADKNTTEEQIKQKYKEFIAFLDTLMKDDTEWVKLRGDEFKPNLITDDKN